MAAKKTPRISVNKLAEYLEASAPRRKRIVYDAKYPSKVIVTRYKDAREIMKSYIAGDHSEDDVLEAIEGIANLEAETDFQENDNKTSVEALEALLETDTSMFNDMTVSTYEDGNKLINIKGVDISVNPDLVIRNEIDSVFHVGAVKIHVSKTNALSEEGQYIVAVMLHLYVQGYFKIDDDEVVSPKLCFSFDVFQESIRACPNATKLRLKRIEAACEEIAMWWDNV